MTVLFSKMHLRQMRLFYRIEKNPNLMRSSGEPRLFWRQRLAQCGEQEHCHNTASSQCDQIHRPIRNHREHEDTAVRRG